MEAFFTKEEINEIMKDVKDYRFKVPEDLFFCSDDIKEYVEPDLIKNIPFLLWLMTKEPANKYEEDTYNSNESNHISQNNQDEADSVLFSKGNPTSTSLHETTTISKIRKRYSRDENTNTDNVSRPLQCIIRLHNRTNQR